MQLPKFDEENLFYKSEDSSVFKEPRRGLELHRFWCKFVTRTEQIYFVVCHFSSTRASKPLQTFPHGVCDGCSCMLVAPDGFLMTLLFPGLSLNE